MRKFVHFAFCALLFFVSKAQQVNVPTTRATYNFSAGDTFQFRYWQGNGNESFRNHVILSKDTSAVDTVKYIVGDYTASWGDTTEEIYTLLDSPVLPPMIDVYSCFCPQFTGEGWLIDTELFANDTTYLYQRGCSAALYTSFGIIKGLGVVYRETHCPPIIGWGPGGDYYSQLIYWHKVGEPPMGEYHLISGINDLSEQIEISVFPNPASNNFQINCSEEHKDLTQMFLYNIQGQKVMTTPITKGTNTIGTGTIPSGLYFWEIILDNAVLKKGKIVLN